MVNLFVYQRMNLSSFSNLAKRLLTRPKITKMLSQKMELKMHLR